MWISSFVVTIDSAPHLAAAVATALASLPVFHVGNAIGQRLPVVLETTDGAAARDWHDWVLQLPGVVHIDVAFVGVDDPNMPSEEDAASLTAVMPAPPTCHGRAFNLEPSR